MTHPRLRDALVTVAYLACIVVALRLGATLDVPLERLLQFAMAVWLGGVLFRELLYIAVARIADRKSG